MHPSPGGQSVVRRHVVLVDDDRELLGVFTSTVRWLGYDVVAFADELGALTHLRAHSSSVGIAFLDLDMPGIGGLGILKIRNQEPQLLSIPVAILSGRSDMPDVRRYSLVAALQKPASLDVLADLIREHCGAPSTG